MLITLASSDDVDKNDNSKMYRKCSKIGDWIFEDVVDDDDNDDSLLICSSMQY